MINDDSLVKYSIEQLNSGFLPTPDSNNWVDYTRLLKKQIDTLKSGFPGFSNSDLSLLRPTQVQVGMRIIFDDNLDCNCGRLDTDTAPLLAEILEISNSIANVEILGIGAGYDFIRDPERNIRWRSRLSIDLRNYHLLIQLITVPKPNGSPVYYYFNKSIRDYRY